MSSSSSHLDFENLKSQEAVEIETSLDDYLRRKSSEKTLGEKKQECIAVKTTKLMTLLEELMKGEKINSNSTFSRNSFKDKVRDLNAVNENTIHGKTEISHDNHTSTSNVNENVETNRKTSKPIEANNVRLEISNELSQSYGDDSFRKNSSEYNSKVDNKFTNDSFENSQTKFGTPSYDFFKKIYGNESFFISFLQLGRLTPSNKRSKSSVVKLVFPLGFNSLFKKRAASLKKKSMSPRISENSREISDTNRGVVKTSAIAQISPNFNSVETQTIQSPSCSPRRSDFEKRIEFFDDTLPNRPKYSVRKSNSIHECTDKKNDFFSVAGKEEYSRKTKSEKIVTGKKRNCHSPERGSVPSKHRKMEEIIKKSENFEKLQSEKMNSVERVSSKNLFKIEIPPSYKFKAETNVNESKDIFRAEEKSLDENVFSNSTKQMISLKNNNKINEKIFNSKKYIDGGAVERLVPEKNRGNDFGVANEGTIEKQRIKENEGNCKAIVEENEKTDDESDSDFFVEQTPPRCNYLNLDENKLHKSRSFNKNFSISESSKTKSKLNGKKLSDAENSDFGVVGPVKSSSKLEEDASKGTTTEKSAVQKSNFNIMKYERQSKGYENFRVSFCKSPANEGSEKEYCIVASSLKNPDTVKKFTSMFDVKFSEKPTKNMTHLIVGMHESEDGEILPLCTPKFLYALANKKWIVSESWAETCIKYKSIVSEESFETCDPIGGPGCRNARLSNDKLFKNCEIHLFGTFENISKEELSVRIAHEKYLL